MHWLKVVFLCFGLLVSFASRSAGREEPEKFAATLPNGAKVELIGVSFHDAMNKGPQTWWKPDGSDLQQEPYRSPKRYTSRVTDTRQFAVRIGCDEDYSSATFSSKGRTTTQPVIPYDANNQSIPALRAFVHKFDRNQATGTIRVGVSTAPWRKVEQWTDDAWQKHDSDNITFAESKNPLILTWPRQKGRAVILEMVRADVGEVQARRMLLHGRDDRIREESPRIHGKGPGLVKEQYWFWGIKLEDVWAFEFQQRPYEWVEFRNVSLQPGRKTNVEIAVLAAKDKLARGLPVSERERGGLGYILQRLAGNLRFPARGRATYQIESYSALDQEPRLLGCEYVFDGVQYAFSVTEKKPGNFNNQKYFDGEKTIRHEVRNKVANVWDGRRQKNPVYNLQQYFPSETIEDLLDHSVELKGSANINGVACSLLESVISSKERLKVWVTKEPDAYPLRIERYEHDNLRYVYEAEDIKSWNGCLFPRKTTISWYRSDDSLQQSLISSYIVSVESFAPNIEIAASEFTPEFPPGTALTMRAAKESTAADLEATQPAKRLRQFTDIDIEFSIDQAAGKMLLLCFWDMTQRPSRNCIQQLSKMSDELTAENVLVAAVHASKVGKTELNEWVERNNLHFPVGTVRGDEEKTRSIWGVKSLPWLILTDRNHRVIGEGFGLNELEDKLEETNHVEQ
ncbi:MAG: thioredoxin domain-containing protein [Planctomycetota bacterium]|jgi:hypothetical protein